MFACVCITNNPSSAFFVCLISQAQEVEVQSVSNRLMKVLRFLEKTLLRERAIKREKIEQRKMTETSKVKEPSQEHIQVTFSKIE